MLTSCRLSVFFLDSDTVADWLELLYIPVSYFISLNVWKIRQVNGMKWKSWAHNIKVSNQILSPTSCLSLFILPVTIAPVLFYFWIAPVRWVELIVFMLTCHYIEFLSLSNNRCCLLHSPLFERPQAGTGLTASAFYSSAVATLINLSIKQNMLPLLEETS